MPSSPQDSDLDTETNVPDSAWEAIITNLAIRIAPGYGKSVAPDTKVSAKGAYNVSCFNVRHSRLSNSFLSTMPLGQGNKPWRWDNPYVRIPYDPVNAGPDGPLDWS
jgi:hypothetical protein